MASTQTQPQTRDDPKRQETAQLLSQGGEVELEQRFEEPDGSERVERRVYRQGDRLPRKFDHVTETVILRDHQGRLTRAGMEKALRAGGSVLYGGNIIDNVDDLPDEVELSLADAAQTDALKRQIDDEIAALERKRQQLEAARQAAEGSPADRTQQKPEAGSQQQKHEQRQQEQAACQAEQQKHAEQQRQAQQERKGK